jgi:DNA replication and repair protein RecF
LYINSLKLLNFRNYENLEINFEKNFNIIYGDNAQGKTNILEAIFLCASGRSHRTSKDAEMVRLSERGYYIKLSMEKSVMSSSIEILYDKIRKKRIKINEVPIRRMTELMGHLNAVIFSPEDLMIIKEGPSERRRFIDITLSQLKPSYLYDLQQYNKILLQRNSLLKEIQNNESLVETLDVWNERLADVGARIMKVRNEFIKILSKKAHEKHLKLSNGKEELLLKYSPSVKAHSLDSKSEIKECFLRVLRDSRKREMKTCTTMAGPQRDDYIIFLNGLELKQFGSQGQQRTAVLSIKLSEIEIMKELTGEYPVLLLDDVMSELDAQRQKFLFENLDEVQTFITCTDKSFFADKITSNSKVFRVVKGSIQEEWTNST